MKYSKYSSQHRVLHSGRWRALQRLPELDTPHTRVCRERTGSSRAPLRSSLRGKAGPHVETWSQRGRAGQAQWADGAGPPPEEAAGGIDVSPLCSPHHRARATTLASRDRSRPSPSQSVGTTARQGQRSGSNKIGVPTGTQVSSGDPPKESAGGPHWNEMVWAG